MERQILIFDKGECVGSVVIDCSTPDSMLFELIKIQGWGDAEAYALYVMDMDYAILVTNEFAKQYLEIYGTNTTRG